VTPNGELYFTQTEYRTQHETWQKVIASDASFNPNTFTVYGKDGSQQIYIGIKASAPNTLINRLWALSEVKDAQGNAYTISYGQDTNKYDYWPTRIDYTTNPGAGLSQPYNAVVFTYASRTDQTPTYEAGSL